MNKPSTLECRVPESAKARCYAFTKDRRSHWWYLLARDKFRAGTFDIVLASQTVLRGTTPSIRYTCLGPFALRENLEGVMKEDQTQELGGRITPR